MNRTLGLSTDTASMACISAPPHQASCTLQGKARGLKNSTASVCSAITCLNLITVWSNSSGELRIPLGQHTLTQKWCWENTWAHSASHNNVTDTLDQTCVNFPLHMMQEYSSVAFSWRTRLNRNTDSMQKHQRE